MEKSNYLTDFENFMSLRLQASTDFVEGKFESLKNISAKVSPATIFPPSGSIVQDADEVNRFNEKGAALFLPGAQNTFEVLHQNADQSLAYWTGIQRSTVRMKGHDEDVVFNLRVTEVFRKDANEWKLIHRHADPLKD